MSVLKQGLDPAHDRAGRVLPGNQRLDLFHGVKRPVSRSHARLAVDTRFSHVLLDQTTLTPETVTGKVRTRIVQLLLMAASGHHTPEALRLAAALAASPEASDESILNLFVQYLTTTQDPEGINLFDKTMKDHGIDIGATLMTYAQELMEKGRAEGRTEGRMKTQVENVQGFLQAGVAWR